MGARSSEQPLDRDLPQDVYAGLVETLFGTTGSFVSGLFGGVLASAIAWIRTGEAVFAASTGVVALFVVFRVIVFLMHRRSADEDRLAGAQRWELAYALGGVGFMTTVGITAAMLVDGYHDELTASYGLVIVLGCVGAVAGRNAGRPRIVLGQTLGLCLPVAAVFLFRGSPWYWGLSLILVLVMTSTKSTTRYLNQMLLSAILSERESRAQRTILAAALDSMTHGLCMAGPDGVLTVVNRRMRDAFGLPDVATPATLDALAAAIAGWGGMDADASARFVRSFHAHLAGREARHWIETVGPRMFLFRAQPLDAGGSVVVVEDVTEARRATQKVEYLAHFDALTGLVNRFQFHQDLEASLGGPGGDVALLAIDLDRFKEVNDTLGHPAGDALLRQVADRLRSAIDATATVARFGGDEFQVLLRSPPDGPRLDAVAQSFIARLSEPYVVDGNAVSIGASIGIARAPADAKDADDLLRCADMALYGAKGIARGTALCFAPAMQADLQRRRQVENELRDALAAGHFEVFYQPTIDVRTARVVTCEALVRWRHPEQGLVPPDAFIPVAEECGLIADLGEFVLRRACADAVDWPEGVRVAVNVSPRQFLLRRDLPNRIAEILAETGLPAGRLEIEITESTLLDARDPLAALARQGVRISLDDFGTGYSGLSYLQMFTIDKVKIDRRFVQVGDRASLAIIEAVSGLAAALDMEVVVEGVETPEQIRTVVERRIHLVQGYLFSRPKPLAEIVTMLDGRLEVAATAMRAVA